MSRTFVTMEKSLRIPVSHPCKELSAIITEPNQSNALVVFAHGAGAGILHKFMTFVATDLAAREITTLRFNFPYMEMKKGRPESQAKAVEAFQEVIDYSQQYADSVFIGGKSYGGRMASWVQHEKKNSNVKGLIYWGFPLHAPGKPSNDRADHLYDIKTPMLFLQGTRDALADLTLLSPVVEKVPSAQMHIVEGGDHSFHVPKAAGRTDNEVLEELGGVVREWIDAVAQ